MIFVKYKIKYRKYHPVFGNTHAGLVFHTHVWFLPHIWKSLRYLVKTTHVRFLPNTFWGWRAVTSNIWLRLEKQQCWNAIESVYKWEEIYVCVCVWWGGWGGVRGLYKLGELQKIWKNAVYVVQGDFCKIEDPIWNLLSVNICGYFHTCLVFPTRVW